MTVPTLDELKTILDAIANRTEIDVDDLLAARFVQRLEADHPEYRKLPAVRRLGLALADLWTCEFKPTYVSPEFKSAWDEFLILETPDLYPLRIRRPRKYTLNQIGMLLADRKHLARVIADGNEARERELLEPRYADFWNELIPAGMPAAPSTLSYRRKKALQNLAAAIERVERTDSGSTLNQQLELTLTTTVKSVTQPQVAANSDANQLAEFHQFLRTRAPTFLPPKWQFVDTIGGTDGYIMLRSPVGSGKTRFLDALTHRLLAAGQEPLCVDLPAYAPHATTMDLLHFAAQCGEFALQYRSEVSRIAYEHALVDAQRHGRLVVLADDADQLLEEELAVVGKALRRFPRVVYTARNGYLDNLLPGAAVLPLPVISKESMQRILSEKTSLDGAGTADTSWSGNPGLAILAAQLPERHPTRVLDAWVARRLQSARQRPGAAVPLNVARRVLDTLAAVHMGIVGTWCETRALVHDNMRRAFIDLQLEGKHEELGRAAVELLVRAGLLEKSDDRWEFASGELADFMAAEYCVRRDARFYSLEPRYQRYMRWTAALLERRSLDEGIAGLCDWLGRTMAGTLPLNWLDVADIVAEFAASPTAAVTEFRYLVVDKLHALHETRSPYVQNVVDEKLHALGVRADAPGPRPALAPVISPR